MGKAGDTIKEGAKDVVDKGKEVAKEVGEKMKEGKKQQSAFRTSGSLAAVLDLPVSEVGVLQELFWSTKTGETVLVGISSVTDWVVVEIPKSNFQSLAPVALESWRSRETDRRKSGRYD